MRFNRILKQFILLIVFSTKVFAQENEEEAILTYKMAQEEFNKGDYLKAKDYLEKVCKLSESAKIKATYLLARSYYSLIKSFNDDTKKMLNSLENSPKNYYEGYITFYDTSFISNFYLNYSFYRNNGKDEEKRSELLKLKVVFEQTEEHSLYETTKLYVKASNYFKSSRYEEARALFNECKEKNKYKNLIINPFLNKMEENNITFQNYHIDFYLFQISMNLLDDNDMQTIKNANDIYSFCLSKGYKHFPKIWYYQGYYNRVRAAVTHDFTSVNKLKREPINVGLSALLNNYSTIKVISYGSEASHISILYLAKEFEYLKYMGQTLIGKDAGTLSPNESGNKHKILPIISESYTKSYSIYEHLYNVRIENVFVNYRYGYYSYSDLYYLTLALCRIYKKENNQKKLNQCCENFYKLCGKPSGIDLIYLNCFYDSKSAKEGLQKLISEKETNNYEIACTYGLLDNIESSLVYLEKHYLDKDNIINLNYYWAMSDPDLENVRANPKFNELMKKYFPDKF